MRNGMREPVGSEWIEGTRYLAGSWSQSGTDRGEYSHGGTQNLKFRGSIVPSEPRHTEQLPEGERTKDSLVVKTQFDLQVARTDDNDKVPADILDVDGESYRVVKIATTRSGLPHDEAICVKVEDS